MSWDLKAFRVHGVEMREKDYNMSRDRSLSGELVLCKLQKPNPN